MPLAARKKLLKSTTPIRRVGRKASGTGMIGSAAANNQVRRESSAAATVRALRRPNAAAR